MDQDCKRTHPQAECACVACENARAAAKVRATAARCASYAKAGHKAWAAKQARGGPQAELGLSPLPEATGRAS